MYGSMYDIFAYTNARSVKSFTEKLHYKALTNVSRQTINPIIVGKVENVSN